MMLQSPARQAARPARTVQMDRPLARAIFGRRLGIISQQIAVALGQDVVPLLHDLRQPLSVAEIERLTAAAARGDATALSAALQYKQMQGQSSEHLCLTFLTLVARRLGEWWEEDRCTFVEVTLGMILLHQQLRALVPGLVTSTGSGRARSALMMTAIGCQHSMGIAMVAEFFRAAGWAISDEAVPNEAALVERVSRQWFGLVAISAGSSGDIPGLACHIAAIRAHSRNPDIAVMLGGPALLAHPEIAAAAGADSTAPDAAEALRRAEALVALMQGAE